MTLLVYPKRPYLSLPRLPLYTQYWLSFLLFLLSNLSMAPTAAMLILSHHSRPSAFPPPPPPPSAAATTKTAAAATYFGLKGLALKWVSKGSIIFKAQPDENDKHCTS
ncbi:hypothetical protein O6P43_012470 [Quillaja saponaria]|uniref:Uncharacterized protein n=1 Tax=Quillaja saponaria TaxID=32244 RepID=A0AAD7M240_QUISA|nr:hypothetical protein O6P43_012470 [Quillaja saponaria]